MGAAAGLFPAYTEADWRKAAEAALRGASLETLVSKTADGVRIEPVYRPAEGPRALGPDGPVARYRPSRPSRPRRGQRPGARRPRQRRGRSSGRLLWRASAPTVTVSGDSIPRLFTRPSMACVSTQGRVSSSISVPTVPRQALGFAALIERAGVKPADCAVSFGLDPFAASARRTVSGRLARAGGAPSRERARDCEGWALARRSWRPTRAAFTRPAAARRRNSPLRFRPPSAYCACSRRRGRRPPRPARSSPSVWRPTPTSSRPWRNSARCASPGRESRTRAGLSRCAAHVHAESAWRMMTARDPYVNVMRGAMAAFSAGLGGADSVSVLPHTLAVGLPDSLARRLARNAQLILLRESHLGFVADPAAGAGAFEALTEALCERAWALFQEIEGEGGLPSTLASGAFQRQVVVSANALARDIATVKSPITGVSAHADLAEPRVDVALGAPKRETLTPVEGALAPIRLAEPFERLRDKSDATLLRTSSRPRVYLVALGPEPAHRGRVAFMREWLEAGGFEAVYDGESATAEEAVERMRASGAPLACLCGDDRAYAAHAEAFAKSISASGVKGLALAGRPGERETEWRDRGRRGFHFRRRRRPQGARGPLSPLSGPRRKAPGIDARHEPNSRFLDRPVRRPVELGRRRRAAESGRRPRASSSSRSTDRVTAKGSSSQPSGQDSRLTCAGPIRRCTSSSPGRCDSTPGSRPPRSRTPSTAPISPPARKASPSLSIWRPIAATIRIIRASPATLAWPASRSIRSMTCGRSFPASRSIRSASR